MKPRGHESDARDRHWVVGALCLYLIALSILAPAHRAAAAPFSLVPVAAAAWAFGARGGLALGLALIPVQLLMCAGTSAHQLPLVVAGSLLTAVIGWLCGVLFERLRTAKLQQRACEERYERAARGANDGLFEWNLSRGHTYFSARWGEMLGAEPGQFSQDVDAWLSRVHPADVSDLRAAIEAHRARRTARFTHEHRLRRTDGTWLWVHVRGSLDTAEGDEVLTGWISDISGRKSAEQELRFHAFRDPLTGLANRSLFSDRLAQALARARATGARTCVLLIDLDQFKRVNDGLGHAAGDGLLLRAAERLTACVDRLPDATVARVGGDEFALLLPELESDDQAFALAADVRNALLAPALIHGRAVTSGASIGVVINSGGDATPADVMRDADTTMHHAKAKARGEWAVFDPGMRARAVERMRLENELRSGLVGGEFEVFYQPIVNAAGNFAGFEALPRWHHPRLGLLLPGDFIQLAEETGLIMDLGDFVLSEACEMGKRVADIVKGESWTVNVNLSPKQIRRADLAQRIEMVLAATGLEPAHLCIEVTEDVILEQLPLGSDLLSQLRQRGVKLCMDDFGTGYSSLSYLHRFRVDYLKIETAFVHAAEAREGGVQIVRSLVNLARNLGVIAVAEGVETARQWELLTGLGCPRAQGFFFAEPLTASDLELWITERFAACA